MPMSTDNVHSDDPENVLLSANQLETVKESSLANSMNINDFEKLIN